MTSAVPAPGSGLTGSRVVPGRWIAIGIAMFGLVAAVGLGWMARPHKVAPAGPTHLSALPARSVWTPLTVAGEPPGDIIDGLVVPVGAGPARYINHDGNASQYDREADFTVGAAPAGVVAFYQRQLAAHGWHVQAVQPARSGPGTQVFATRNGADSYAWAVVATIRSAGTGSAVGLELQQMPDPG